MAINLGDAFQYLELPQTGIGSFQLPRAKQLMPGYNEEMNIDDSGRITFRNYLQELRDKAGEGLGTIADKGLSLFNDSRKSNLIRAGLGSVLFGFSPLTAILGAVIGAKTPQAFDYFQQQRDKKAAEEAAAAQEEFDRIMSSEANQRAFYDSLNEGRGATSTAESRDTAGDAPGYSGPSPFAKGGIVGLL